MESARCKAFMVAAQVGSITGAAEMLGYTPSGVSQLIAALEGELGFPLLIRGKRGVTPTEDGKSIMEAVGEYLLQEERIYQLASEINGLTVGSITIGAFSSIAANWLPAVIKDFQSDYPNIHIHLMEGIRQEVDEWLSDKRIDLAFYSFQEPMDYEWIPLAYDPMIAVLPKDHPLAGEKVYPLSRCEQEDFIMPALGRDADVAEMFRRTGITPKIKFSTLENFAAIAMIGEGLGMSIMNALITKNWESNVVKLPVSPPQQIEMGIALRSLKKASPAVKKFVDYSKQRLGKL